jgi:hypothetical protein
MQESSSKPKLFKICENDFRMPKESLTLSTVFTRRQFGDQENKR